MIDRIVARARLTSLLLLALLFVAGTSPSAAQESGPVTAVLRAAKSQATIGDPIQLTLVITHPAGYQAIVPQVGEAWGAVPSPEVAAPTDWAVVSQAPATIVDNGDGTETTTAVVDARLFSTGTVTTPPLEVAVTDGAGNLTRITFRPATVSIASVLPSGGADLRDIKPQAGLRAVPVALVVAAALLAAVVLVAAVLWRRNRRPQPVVDTRTPNQRAMDELAAIEAMALPAQGRYKEHYTLVSHTIRTYVEQRYGVPALERTTTEIRRDLRQTGMPPAITALLVAFLQESDLIKFSTFTPDMESAQELLEQGRAIVEATAPAPEEPAAAGGNTLPLQVQGTSAGT
jgi:hypothetical protein